MNIPILINISIIVVLLTVAIVARHLYLRNQRLKHKAQLSMLFTSISHELLTPLTILSASVEQLKDKEPKYSLEYELMELNIQRSVRQLQLILETSKSTDGRLKLLVSHGDVMRYIRDSAKCIVPLVQQKGIKFNISCQPESMMGWIDTDKIDKIIFNLLSNAVKYTNNDHGKIELTVKTNKRFDEVTIEVSDNGCGIPGNRQKHIFEMFYDGDYRRFGAMGNGIGLALTRDIVLLNKGTIEYESKENIGTKFTITLPIVKEAFDKSQIDESHKINFDNPQMSIDDFPKVQQLLNKEELTDKFNDDHFTLLIVEDNKQLLMLMKMLLSKRYNVFTATNGKEALETIERHDIDLIVSDVMMPEMDGWELTERIKVSKDFGHLPIILITARTQEEDKKKSLLIGADEYITKPFKMGDLQLRIENIIQNRLRIQNELTTKGNDGEVAIPTVTSPDDEFISNAKECVKQHIDDSDYNRDTFATDMGMSASSLYNKLRSTTGLNVSAFIRTIRMEEACRIAKSNPSIRVNELAYRVGYKDPKYFSTSFKKDIGLQPTEYLDKLREGVNPLTAASPLRKEDTSQQT